MKPFVFRLEAVQMLRESEQQQAFEAYGEAIARRRKLEDAARATSQKLQQMREHISQLRASVFPASLQPHFMAALQDGEEHLQSILLQLSRAEEEEQKRLDAFLEAKSRVDILEKLREKRQQSHLREQYRAEEKALEDVVNTRYVPAF